MEIFTLMNENEVIELEYHYCAIPNELTEQNQLLTSQEKETTRHNGPPGEKTHHHLPSCQRHQT